MLSWHHKTPRKTQETRRKPCCAHSSVHSTPNQSNIWWAQMAKQQKREAKHSPKSKWRGLKNVECHLHGVKDRTRRHLHSFLVAPSEPDETRQTELLWEGKKMFKLPELASSTPPPSPSLTNLRSLIAPFQSPGRARLSRSLILAEETPFSVSKIL